MPIISSPTQFGGYLTPRTVYGATAAAPLTQSQAFTLSQQSAPDPHQDPWPVTGAKILGAAPLDVVDSIAAVLPGVERGQVNDTVYESLGMPSAARWVRDNRAGVEIASGILGAVVVGGATEFAIGKAATSAWATASGLNRVLAPVTTLASRAQAAAESATLAAASEGTALGILSKANLSYLGAATLQATLKAGVSEAAIAATMNQNSFIWSDDMSQNLLMAGLGLAGGAALGVIGARAQVNRWANSSAVRDAAAQAADPGGFARMQTTGSLNTPIVAPKDSTVLTGLMLDAKRDDIGTGMASQANLNLRRNVQSEAAAEARTILQRIALRGDDGIPGSAFGVKNTSQGQHLIETIEADPVALYGMASVSRIDPAVPVEDMLKTRTTNLETVIKGKYSTKAARAKAKAQLTQTPVVLVNREWVTTAEAEAVRAFEPEKLTFGKTAKQSPEVTWLSPASKKKITIREDGKLNVPWENLSTQDLLGTIEGMKRLMTNLRGQVLTLPKNPHFSQIDMMVEFEKRGGTVDWVKSGFANAEEAQVKSLALKADAVANLDLDFMTRLKHNLPAATAAEKISDPTGTVLKQVLNAAKKPGATLADLQAARKKLGQVLDLTQELKAGHELDGDIFNFNRDRNGKWMAPVLGFFDDVPMAKWTKADLADMTAETDAFRINTLRTKTNAPTVKEMTQAIISNPRFSLVRDISGLLNSQINGNGSRIGATFSQFLTQQFRRRNSEILLGAEAMRRRVTQIAHARLDEVFKSIGHHVDYMTSKAGQNSRVMMNHYLSNAGGWDIDKAIQNANGHFEFTLKRDSELNIRRLGRPVRADDRLTNADGVTVVLDGAANAMRQALEGEFSKLLRERNAIREALGLDPVKRRPFYVPPPSTEGKFVGFTLDAANRPVSGGAVIEDTKAAYDSAVADLTAKLPPGHRIVSQDEIRRFVHLWEQAQLDFVDPRSLANRNKATKGALQTEKVNAKALEDALAYIKDGYNQLASGAIQTVFAPQLRLSRMRGAADVLTNGLKSGTNNIWQEYDRALLGLPATVNPRGATQTIEKIDEWLDQAIATAWPALTLPKEWLRDVLDKTGAKGVKGRVKSFDDLANALGPYMPFKQVADYAEYTHNQTPPWKARDFARGMNKLSAAIILRWFEIPHAAMNMTGIITNMPGLVRSRNVPIVGRVNGVPVYDTVRIMARGFKRMVMEGDPKRGIGWQNMSRDYAFMVRNGDASQEVAEMEHHFALLQGRKGDFQRFLVGDPKATTLVGRKGLEGVISIMTDTSESMSRRWAHFVGLELADYHGIVGMEARHDFARQIANDAIANYDPLNRPELYNSAFGSMYGLFMSYAQNYYQRLFSYVEKGDYGSLGTALALQASMFGLFGLPGSRQLAALFGGGDDGAEVMGGIYSRFGPALGNVVAQGGFNQITTLFGLPAVALHTRGDINIRSPAIDFAASGQLPTPVGMEVLKDVVTGVWQVASGIAKQGDAPMSGQLAAEILARNMPNRALRGAIAVMAGGGREADAYGNLISETQTQFEDAYRMLGIRSGRQQAEIEAYFMNQKRKALDAERMDKLRVATRALVRSGEYDRLPETFDSYLRNGGAPWNYGTWIRGIIKDASQTRTQNQLLQSMRSPVHQDLANRIEQFMAPF